MEVQEKEIAQMLESVGKKLKKLEKSFDNGKIIKDGIKTAIIGKPNAGKSSLLNAILKEDRAIVTDIAGTTRDTIEEFVQIDGVPLKIIDTAGIRNANDSVEKIGVEKAMEIAEKSDIVIAIFDITRELNEEDEKILKLIENKNAIIVLNKIDIKNNNLKEKIINKIKEKNKTIINISTKTREGIDELYKEISKIFKLKELASNGEIVISNNRHKYLINSAHKEIEQAKKSIAENMPSEIISTNIRNALEELGKITGETVTDDVIKEIFSKFCLGK